MGGRQPEEDIWSAFAHAFPLPPPGVVVQVYRPRSDNPKKWKYLGAIELEGIDLAHLESVTADALEAMVPFEETRQTWGGGKYQFRFRWRDERGLTRPVRSRNAAIAGPPRDL